MDSRFSVEQAKFFAQLEEEAGGVISAGVDVGDRLRDLLQLQLSDSYNAPANALLEVVSAQVGDILSSQDVLDLVAGFQATLQQKVADKLNSPRSA
jgi:hypothetical protein